MDKPYKRIKLPLKEVPQELKPKVMGDVARAKRIMDLGPRFSFNIGDVFKNRFKK